MTSSNSERPQVIVLLHPFPFSNVFWNQLKPIAGYSFFKPNFPGFGGEIIEKAGFTLEQAAQKLEHQLNDLKTEKPFILAGISMGGYWALEYYKQFPEQVDQLILISTRSGVDTPESQQNRLRMAQKVEIQGVDYLPEALIPGLLGRTSLSEKSELKRQLTTWIHSTPPEAIGLAQRAMAHRQDQTRLLSQIKARTLIMAGKEDTLIAPAEAQAMSQAIPNNQLKILESSGHLIPIEVPQIFQKTLEDFLCS